MLAKNNVLIKGKDSIAFSIYRSKDKAIIAYIKDYKLEEEVVVNLIKVDEYWLQALQEGYEVRF
jgi:predicted ATP-grasp superfamily ATP-dependent carboligase